MTKLEALAHELKLFNNYPNETRAVNILYGHAELISALIADYQEIVTALTEIGTPAPDNELPEINTPTQEEVDMWMNLAMKRKRIARDAISKLRAK